MVMGMSKFILIPKEIVDTCKRFAERQYGTSHDCYSQRNQNNPEKIKQDIVVGKIGEWGVYLHLNQIGVKCQQPDMLVYGVNGKNWNCDLVSGSYRLCVKSQAEEQSKIFGKSWIFQYGSNNGGHRDSIFSEAKDNDIFVGCIVSMTDITYVKIMVMVKVLDLSRLNLFDEPKKKELEGIKKAVYYDRIKEVVGDVFVDLGEKEVVYLQDFI